MYAKIALGNVRKSFRDFSVFFLTLAFGVCVFYAFGSITDQAAVIQMGEDQRRMVQALTDILSGLSVFVVVILGFLVVYANRFLIRRRKREFGIYLTLGMDIRHVSWIVVIETLVVGVVALGVGLLLGLALSQVMMYVTAGLFEATIKGFVFAFSPAAALSTVACFAGIFLVTLVFNVTTVSRYKLIDLINADKVSEKVRLRSLPLSVVLFLVSLVLIGVAYKTLLEHGMMEEGPYFAIATGLVTVGTLLFFFSISGFALRALQASPRAYLSGLNMFVMRQLNSRSVALHQPGVRDALPSHLRRVHGLLGGHGHEREPARGHGLRHVARELPHGHGRAGRRALRAGRPGRGGRLRRHRAPPR